VSDFIACESGKSGIIILRPRRASVYNGGILGHAFF